MRRSPVLLVLLVVAAAACGGSTTTPPPQAGTPTTSAPSAAPSAAPVGSLDPTQSDAGIAASVTISNDSGGERDGTHVIYGVDADGSECDGSFEEPDYTVVAWHEDAPIGQIHRFGISVAADDVPDADGETTDLDQARVSFDFVSESGFGTQYTGDATSPDEGSATVDITRVGDSLTFDFSGTTSDGVNFEGQFLCEEI